jgi:hypothetical protein
MAVASAAQVQPHASRAHRRPRAATCPQGGRQTLGLAQHLAHLLHRQLRLPAALAAPVTAPAPAAAVADGTPAQADRSPPAAAPLHPRAQQGTLPTALTGPQEANPPAPAASHLRLLLHVAALPASLAALVGGAGVGPNTWPAAQGRARLAPTAVAAAGGSAAKSAGGMQAATPLLATAVGQAASLGVGHLGWAGVCRAHWPPMTHPTSGLRRLAPRPCYWAAPWVPRPALASCCRAPGRRRAHVALLLYQASMLAQ